VKGEIMKLKQNKLNRALISEEDIFQKYIDIAFSDITDYIDFGTKEVPAISKDGKVSVMDVTYSNIKNSDEIDGTLITEISNAKGEVKIKLQDQMKALQWLSEHMDLATEEQRITIKKLNEEINMLKLKQKEIESNIIDI
jgi:phage terminase small subunit